jgi:hypothetical protein
MFSAVTPTNYLCFNVRSRIPSLPSSLIICQARTHRLTPTSFDAQGIGFVSTVSLLGVTVSTRGTTILAANDRSGAVRVTMLYVLSYLQSKAFRTSCLGPEGIQVGIVYGQIQGPALRVYRYSLNFPASLDMYVRLG